MATAPASTPPHPHPPVGRIVLTVIGALLIVPALALGTIGSVLLWAHTTQRDADGFFTSDGGRLETVARAITSEDIDLGVRPGGRERRFDLGDLATVRLTVDPQTRSPSSSASVRRTTWPATSTASRTRRSRTSTSIRSG